MPEPDISVASPPSRPEARKTSLRQRLPYTLLALGIGSAGGGVFYLLGLPLPWMLGALVAVLIAVMARAPVLPPDRARPAVVAVIGVMLGSSFTPDVFADITGWILSLSFLVLYLGVASAITVPFYIRIGRSDPITAFFSAMPGGLTEMMLIGGAMGGDERRIVLAHAARVVVTIGLIAFWFRVVLGLDVSRSMSLGSSAELGIADFVLLAAAGVLGAVVGVALRLPAPTLLGPMLASAAVHLVGLTAGAPPAVLVIAGQIILGTIMGCRFLGSPLALVWRALALGFGATLLTLAVSLGFALAFHRLFGETTAQVLLAYAPGGLTEMSLVALAMQADVAYITLHHVVRIVLLVAIAPSVLTVLAKRLSSDEG